MRSSTCLPLRTAVFLLAVLFVLTPVTQVLAQTAQQEQESHATQTSEPNVIPFPATFFPVTVWNAALDVPALAADTVSLVRLGATSIFPKSDSLAFSELAAANATPAPMAKGVKVVLIVVGALVVIAVILGVLIVLTYEEA